MDDIFEHHQVAQEYAGALALALYLHPWLSAWWTTLARQMGYSSFCEIQMIVQMLCILLQENLFLSLRDSAAFVVLTWSKIRIKCSDDCARISLLEKRIFRTPQVTRMQ